MIANLSRKERKARHAGSTGKTPISSYLTSHIIMILRNPCFEENGVAWPPKPQASASHNHKSFTLPLPHSLLLFISLPNLIRLHPSREFLLLPLLQPRRISPRLSPHLPPNYPRKTLTPPPPRPPPHHILNRLLMNQFLIPSHIIEHRSELDQ